MLKKTEKPAEEERDIEALLVEIEVLRDELASVRATADKTKDDLLRKAADLDNARKRLSKERTQIQNRAAERIIRALLPALNDLARAIEAADADETVPQHHVDAIVMMEKKVFEILKAEGLEPINAKPGDPFDPEVHEAVMATCQPDIGPGQIISVMDGGYMFKDRLLIPTRVEVCVEESGQPEGNKDTG
ncbi:MAG: nucleotide exchange factor GrpE [bacterium]|nr:nucleotide exchange factor GrpE [bacterium]